MSFLKQQLQNLQQEKITQLRSGIRKQIPTLIFGEDSKQIPLQTVHEISLAALHELQTHSPVFAEFENSIFSAETVCFDRDVADPLVVKQINEQIIKFIKMLAGYFHFPCAIRSLEYLVRRFRIDLYFQDQLFLQFLPYHDLEYFKILIDAIHPKLLDGYDAQFPLARAQMYQFFVKNSFQILNLIFQTLNTLITTQAKQVYYRFVYTVLMELASSEAGNQQELCRKILDQCLFDIKSKKLQSDSKYYVLSAMLLVVSRQQNLVNSVYIDKFIYYLLNENQLEKTEELTQFLYKLLQYIPNYQFSDQVAKQLLSLCDTQLQIKQQNKTNLSNKYDQIISIIFISLLKSRKIDQLSELNACVQQINNFIQDYFKVQIQNFMLHKSLKTLTRLLLVLYNNQNSQQLTVQNLQNITKPNAQNQVIQLINQIEKHDQTIFNEGLQEYIKNGGNVEQVQQVIKNQLSLLLNKQFVQQDNQQQITYHEAFAQQNTNIRYQAYQQLNYLIEQKILNISKKEEDEMINNLVYFLFNQIKNETELQIVKLILNLIIRLQTNSKIQIGNEIEVCNAIVMTTKRAIFQQSHQIYELCEQIINVIKLNKINNTNLSNTFKIINKILNCQIELQQISCSDDISKQIKFIEKQFATIKYSEFMDSLQINNNDIIGILNTNSNSLHYKSILVLFAIDNLNTFINQVNNKIVNEILQNRISKHFLLSKFQQLDQSQQKQYQYIINNDEELLEIYLCNKAGNIGQFIQQFVSQFTTSENDKTYNIKQQNTALNDYKQLIIYNKLLVEQLNKIDVIDNITNNHLVSLVYLYSKNNLVKELTQIQNIIISKQKAKSKPISDKKVKKVEELQSTKFVNSNQINNLFFDIATQQSSSNEEEFIIQLIEFLQCLNFEAINEQQQIFVIYQIMNILNKQMNQQLVVQVIIDLVTYILQNDNLCKTESVNLSDGNNQVISNYFKIKFVEQLVQFISQHQHLDFQLELLLQDQINFINDYIICNNNIQEQQADIDSMSINLQICLQLICPCCSSQQYIQNEDLMNIPYIIWILSDYNMFNECKENTILKNIISQSQYVNGMKQLSINYIRSTVISVNKNQLVFDTNPMVFINHLLFCRKITDKENLIQKLIQLILTKEDDLLILYSIQLIIKLIQNVEMDTNSCDENTQVSEEVQPKQIVFNPDEIKQLIEYLLNNQARIQDNQLVDRLIQFIQLVDVVFLKDQFIPKLYQNVNTITTNQNSQILQQILTKYDQIDCLQLISLQLELITVSQLKQSTSPQSITLYISTYLSEVVNYIPEFLAAYMIFLMNKNKENRDKEIQYFIDPIQIMQNFKFEQQLGSISILLGYLFDVNEVIDYLQQETETYQPMQVLDMFMKNDDSILSQSIIFIVQTLKQLNLQQNADQLSQLQCSSITKSLTKEEAPIVFLLKICLHLPNNIQNISQIVADCLSFDQILSFYKNNDQQLLNDEGQTFSDHFKYLIIQQFNNTEYSQQQYFKLVEQLSNLLLTQFNNLSTQLLINIVLQKIERYQLDNNKQQQQNYINFQELLVEINNNLLNIKQGQDIDNAEFMKVVFSNMGLIAIHLDTSYIQFIQPTFEQIFNNINIKSLQQYAEQLMIKITTYHPKYLLNYLPKILTVISDSKQLNCNDESVKSALNSIAKFIPAKLLIPKYSIYIQQYVLANIKQYSDKISENSIAIVDQLLKFNLLECKQFDLKIVCLIIQILKNIRVSVNFINQSIHQLMESISQVSVTFIGSVNLAVHDYQNINNELIEQFLKFNESDGYENLFKSKKHQAEEKHDAMLYQVFIVFQTKLLKLKYYQQTFYQQKPNIDQLNSLTTNNSLVINQQSILNQKYYIESNVVENTNAVILELLQKYLQFYYKMFLENLTQQQETVDDFYRGYHQLIKQLSIKSKVLEQFLEMNAKQTFQVFGRQFGANPMVQDILLKILKKLAESQHITELVYALQGIVESHSEVEVNTVLKGVLGELVENEQLESKVQVAMQLVERICQKEWKEL